MSKLKKHFIFVYIASFIALVSFAIKTLILPVSNNLYQYVPAESDVVIEINAVNLIKEISYQWLYEHHKFVQDHPLLKDKESTEKLSDYGINPFSKVLIFNEKWADESLWFAVLTCNNAKKFSTHIEEYFPRAQLVVEGKTAIIQLSKSLNQTNVSEHIANIMAKKVKSIAANPVIKREFSDLHEINIYLKAIKSKYVSDGYLNVNFDDSHIELSGFFQPVGANKIEPIAYQLDSTIGLSLRSSLNLLNTIYLFNDTKLDYLPDYRQLAVDYDGVNLLTNNDVIPITSFPNMNLLVDVYNDKDWLKYLDASVEDGSLLMKSDTIMINSEAKVKIRYSLENKQFRLFQKSKDFTNTSDSNEVYFDLKIHPDQIIDKMFYSEDPENPPKLVATQIIKIMKNILADFNYLKAVEEINFSIQKSPNSTNYISKGQLIFENKKGHASIESIFLFQNFLETLGTFVR